MRTITCTLALTLAASLSSAAQQPPQAPSPAVKTAEQQYKNIKALTGTPANQLNLSMHMIAADLGVECVHCHIWEHWDLDVKPTKEIARRMIVMVREMNKNFFGDAQIVTCYTCHRGSPTPVSIATLPDTVGLRGPSVPGAPLPVIEHAKQSPSFPPVAAILQKYVSALGGEEALRRVTSRVITARRDIGTGPGGLVPVLAQVEIYEQAPNLMLAISKAEKFSIAEGFDGLTAWSQNMEGVVTNLGSPDQERARRNANFYANVDLARNYSRQEVIGIEKVNGRDAYVVAGYPADDTPEKLYFDVQTGLLLRRWATLPASLGNYPYQIDYDDYRTTNMGVKFPFIVRTVPANPRSESVTNSTLQVSTVRENVPIDVGKFNRPSSLVPAGPGRQ